MLGNDKRLDWTSESLTRDTDILRGEILYLNNKPILQYTIEHAKSSKYINKIIVSTDNQSIADLAKDLGAEVPFLRDRSLSEDYIDLERVLNRSLAKIQELGIYPDLLVSLEVTFPFRPDGIIDRIIDEVLRNGFDSMIAARIENKSIWKHRDGKIYKWEEGLIPRKYKEPIYIGLRGICCITHPENLSMGSIYGHNVGIYNVQNAYSSIEVRSKDDIKLAEILMSNWGHIV